MQSWPGNVAMTSYTFFFDYDKHDAVNPHLREIRKVVHQLSTGPLTQIQVNNWTCSWLSKYPQIRVLCLLQEFVFRFTNCIWIYFAVGVIIIAHEPGYVALPVDLLSVSPASPDIRGVSLSRCLLLTSGVDVMMIWMSFSWKQSPEEQEEDEQDEDEEECGTLAVGVILPSLRLPFLLDLESVSLGLGVASLGGVTVVRFREDAPDGVFLAGDVAVDAEGMSGSEMSDSEWVGTASDAVDEEDHA